MLLLLVAGLLLTGCGAWVHLRFSGEWGGGAGIPEGTHRSIETAAVILVCLGVAALVVCAVWVMATLP